MSSTPTPSRIGIDARLIYYSQAGIGLYTTRLIQALARIDQSNHFVILQSRRDDRVIVEQRNFRRFDLWTPCHSPFEQMTLPLELSLTGIDLLHSPDFIPPMRRRCKSVITVHDLAFLLFPDLITEESRRYYGQVAEAVQSVDAVIAVSERTKRDVVRLLGIPVEKIEVIYHASDECFRPIDDEQALAAFRLRCGLPERFILFVGTIEPRKNLVTLMKAYSKLRRSDSTPKLVVVGQRGWFYEDVFEQVDKLELGHDVIFLGQASVEDLVFLYNAALFLVFPSVYEGFGFPPLEAMACGTPVLSSNASSLPEVVGDAALLFEPTDVDGLAASMERLVEDQELRASLVAKGRGRAAGFSWDKTAAATLEVYRRVLKK